MRPCASLAWRTEAWNARPRRSRPRPARVPPGPASGGRLPSQIWSHRFFPDGSATCAADTSISGDPGDTAGTGVRVVTGESVEPPASSRSTLRLDPCLGAAMDAVSTATQGAPRLRPGRRRTSRGRARNSKLTSGSRRRGCSRGDAWPAIRPGECGCRVRDPEKGLHAWGEEKQR